GDQCAHSNVLLDAATRSAGSFARPGTGQRLPGKRAAKGEFRRHIRPSGSCQSSSSTCSLPNARVIDCSGLSGKASMTCA
ncbi:MAG: hypothetical protein ACK559_38665, partial [bacterium]